MAQDLNRQLPEQEIANASLDKSTDPAVPVMGIAKKSGGSWAYWDGTTTNGGFSYNNISTSAQTTVKASAGVLGSVSLNATLTSAVRGYDNTVSGGNTLFTIPAGTAPTNIEYNAQFATGLTVSTGAVADNITVMYN
jgi:hypothetical protein